jgi:hypothetical protein
MADRMRVTSLMKLIVPGVAPASKGTASAPEIGLNLLGRKPAGVLRMDCVVVS